MTLMVPSVAGASTIVRKTAPETVTSSTTLQDDNHLFFTMTSNGVWQVKLLVIATSASSAAMKLNFSAPAGASWRLVAVSRGVTDYLSNELGSDLTTAGVGTFPLSILIEGVVTTAATAGDFRLRWAQSASSANGHTVGINSYLEYRLLT